jgi:hypothetical protein
MRITATQFKDAIDLLERFRTDYQFDKSSEDYLGFINVGSHILDETDIPTWNLICNRAQIFMPILHEMGLEIEGSGLDLEETVFTLAV